MKYFIAALAALCAAAAAPIEHATDRPGGTYASLPAEDAAACAMLCAADGLCLAWSFRRSEARACALKAVAPEPRTDETAASGLTPRAKTYLALTSAIPPAPPEPPAAAPAPQPMPALRPQLPPVAPAAPRVASDEDELLGGL